MKILASLLLCGSLLMAQGKAPSAPTPKPAPKKTMNHYTHVISEKELHVHCVKGMHVSSSRQLNPTTIVVVCEPN